MSNEEWLTLKEAAAVLKISRYSLRLLRQAGKISDSYPNGRPVPDEHGHLPRHQLVRIARSELERYLKAGVASNG